MHEFSIDTNERKIIKGIAMLLAISFVSYFNEHIKDLEEIVQKILGIKSQLELKGVSAFSIYGVILYLYNSKLWKTSLFQKIFSTPDFNGDWECEGITSHKEGDQKFRGKFHITQTWTKIFIRGEFNSSHSKSYTAAIKTNEGALKELIFTYSNDTDELSKDTMFDHKGTAILRTIDKKHLKGTYFNGRGRGNSGSMQLINTRKHQN